jgi:hypothetical protein
MSKDPGGARLVALLLTLALAGCGAPRHASSWSDLKEGMTAAEVEALLGKPSSKVHIDHRSGVVLTQRWQYGEPSTPADAAPRLGFAAPDDVFVVYFGADGRVAGYRRPLVGRYADDGSEGRPSP